MRDFSVPRGILIAALSGALFTVAASLVFLAGTGLLGDFPHPFWQWWVYLWVYGGDLTVDRWLAISAVPAVVVASGFALAAFLVPRRVRGGSLRRRLPPGVLPDDPVRAPDDNHGHACWMTLIEARRLWGAADAEFGGVVVGEASVPHEERRRGDRDFDPLDRRTWGAGGKRPLLVDRCAAGTSTHSLTIAGSGSYKTTCAVSTLLTWTGAAVILDPSEELGPMLLKARRALGHRVFILSPRAEHPHGFNVLDWIDITSPLAQIDVKAVVGWVCGDAVPTAGQKSDSTSEFFEDMGKNLIICLLAHMLWDPELDDGDKTLRTLRAGLTLPEPRCRALLAKIHATSKSSLARDIAATLKGLVSDTFSGVYANATRATAWLSTEAYADLVSGDTFRAGDITRGDIDVFVSLPLKSLHTTPAAARVIIGALLNAAYEADGNVKGRILFLLDEASLLGPMGIVQTARDAGRKYGITLHLIYQSVGQIVAQWGMEGKRSWYESTAWRSYASISDEKTAQELSTAIGEFGALAWSEGTNTGISGRLGAASRSRGKGQTFHSLRRPLIRPEEVMHDLRADEQIVISKRGRPLRCGRAIYFRRPEMVARVAENRFFKEGGRVGSE